MCWPRLNLERAAEKGIQVLLLILVFFTPLIFSMRATTYGITKYTFSQLCILFLLLLWIVRINAKGSFSIQRSPLNIAIGVFFLINLISIFRSASIYNGINALIWLLTYTILFFVVANNFNSLSQLRAIIWAFILAGFLVSLYGILQTEAGGVLDRLYHFFLTRGQHLVALRERRPVSSFGNINFAAQYMVAVIPLSLVFFLFSRNALSMAVSGLMTTTMLFYLLLTQSRGGWVGLAMAMGFLFILILKLSLQHKKVPIWKRVKKRAIVLLRVLLLIAVVFSILSATLGMGRSFVEEALSIFDLTHSTVRFRLLTWGSTWQIFLDNPLLGVGAGNFKVTYPAYRKVEEWRISGPKSRVDQAHNEYLQLASETGILGFMAFMGILTCAGFLFFRLISQIQERPESMEVIAIGAGVVAVLTHSIFSFPLQNPSSTIFFWMALGVLARYGSLLPQKKGVKRRLERKGGGIMVKHGATW